MVVHGMEGSQGTILGRGIAAGQGNQARGTVRLPPCVQLCGLIPESVVKRSGMVRGARWKKQCRQLNGVPRYWEPNPQEA